MRFAIPRRYTFMSPCSRTKERDTYVKAALDAMLHAALETILGVLDVAEVFVLPSELEPRSMVARLRSTLKVAERGAGVMWYELRVYTGRRAHRAHMDCFGDMRRYRTWGRRGDADDERERNVDEFLQLGIVDLGRSHCWVSRCGVGA